MNVGMVQPVVVLAIWSLVVLGWMAAARGRAMRKAGISLEGRRGGRGADLEGRIDNQAVWVAHNYTHLMEQPTLFYAVALTLAVAGDDNPWGRGLAWGYVALRVAHSLVQGTSNVLAVRAALFLTGTGLLIALAARAAFVVFAA